MWEAINSADNLEVDTTITHVFEKFVFVNELFRYVTEFDADILREV